MAISTISSALGRSGGINEESQKILNRLQGHKTAEEMIGEYFGLRKEKIFSDDGKDVIDMVNEFRDPVALKKKKVQFVPYFEKMGMTREMFDGAVPKEYQPNPDEFEPKPTSNGNESDSHPNGHGEPEGEPVVRASRKRTSKD